MIGHGIPASATMGRLRAAIQTLADLEPNRTNRSLGLPTWSSASRRKRRLAIMTSWALRVPAPYRARTPLTGRYQPIRLLSRTPGHG
ncbi:hypothetical protein [Streptomyces sp. SAS_269]|uniref:hypothetical protein n=1 Tax=Streptomyces sp. SAS_269 TaxID=3412749 RepID=UPI00403C9EFF